MRLVMGAKAGLLHMAKCMENSSHGNFFRQFKMGTDEKTYFIMRVMNPTGQENDGKISPCKVRIREENVDDEIMITGVIPVEEITESMCTRVMLAGEPLSKTVDPGQSQYYIEIN